MTESFDKQRGILFKELGEHKNMVLSTSFKNYVTSRMMSVIIKDGVFYFQTAENSRKYLQLQNNPLSSLCADNFQIEGYCRKSGKPEENNDFCRLYKKYYPDAFIRYTSLPDEVLLCLEPSYIKRWLYINGEPYEEIFDFNKKFYEKNRILKRTD